MAAEMTLRIGKAQHATGLINPQFDGSFLTIWNLF